MDKGYQPVEATGNLRWYNGKLQMEVIMADPLRSRNVTEEYLDWSDVPVVEAKATQ